MRESKIIELWAHNRIEMHGGENNSGARRVLCPASGSQAFLPVFDTTRGLWRAQPTYEGGTTSVLGGTSYTFGGTAVARGTMRPGAEAFLNKESPGSFWSQNPVDPDIGANPIKQFDFVTGMPDLRWEHLHIIDCEGFDELRILWAAENVLYEGLFVDETSLSAGDDVFFADTIYAGAWGSEYFDGREGLDFVNYPPGIWLNANDPLNGGTSSSSSDIGITNDPDFDGTPAAVWTTGGTGWSIAAGVATYTHSGGSGTLTQTSGNFARLIFAGKTYRLVYTISAPSGTPPVLALSGVVATPQILTTGVAGTYSLEFVAQLGNFVLTATSGAAGSFAIDDVMLSEDVRPGSGRNRAPYGLNANGASYTDPYVPPLARQLLVTAMPPAGGGITPTDRGEASGEIMSFKNSRLGYNVANAAPVGYGLTQWGSAYRGVAGSSSWKTSGLRTGDRLSARLWVGDQEALGESATGTVPGQMTINRTRPRITGLARIFLVIASLGINFVGPKPTGIGATRVRSVPVGPAIAPRQLVKGRLYAKLVRY